MANDLVVKDPSKQRKLRNRVVWIVIGVLFIVLLVRVVPLIKPPGYYIVFANETPETILLGFATSYGGNSEYEELYLPIEPNTKEEMYVLYRARGSIVRLRFIARLKTESTAKRAYSRWITKEELDRIESEKTPVKVLSENDRELRIQIGP